MNVFIDCVNEKPDYCREIGPNRIFDGFFTRFMNDGKKYDFRAYKKGELFKFDVIKDSNNE